MKLKASIFIPTKNAGNGFYQTLNQIEKQKEKDFEVIIVDSGSKDNTIKVAESFQEKLNLKIYKIPPEEFGHGKTRNLSLKYAKGEFIVFLTQDAIPYNNEWLSKLLENFKDPKVAGVFSRQIPNKNARITEKFFYHNYFPNKKISKSKKKELLFLRDIFFSNVSSVIRKNILKKYPFCESVQMCEDQEWAKKVIEKDYKTFYDSESIVIHSHDYNLKQTFQRYFDTAISLNQITLGGFRNFTKIGAVYMAREFKYVLKEKPSYLPYLFLYNTSKILGTTLGMHEKKIPCFLKRRFSMHKYYWKNKSNL